MTATAPAATPGSAASLTPLQACAAAYIAQYGIHAFMEEDYNLTGTRARAVVRANNAALAAALGLPLGGRTPPVAIDKKEVWDVLEAQRRAANRAELAAFFADTTNVPGLSFLQRLYLEWHYRSPNNYQFTMEKPLSSAPPGVYPGALPGVVRLLGWNQESEVAGPGDFVIYTGLLGCTGLCAVAGDGAAFMSHWDEVRNPRQLDGHARFAARHPGGQVRLVGVTSRDLGAALRQRHPGLDIACHVKEIYFETTYMVRFSRLGGRVEVRFHEADVTDDYVSSCHHGEYGRWFPYGRFSQAFPGPEEVFAPCHFQTVV